MLWSPRYLSGSNRKWNFASNMSAVAAGQELLKNMTFALLSVSSGLFAIRVSVSAGVDGLRATLARMLLSGLAERASSAAAGRCGFSIAFFLTYGRVCFVSATSILGGVCLFFARFSSRSPLGWGRRRGLSPVSHSCSDECRGRSASALPG